MPKGVVQTPTGAYERIVQAIKSLERGEFTKQEVQALVPNIRRNLVGSFLSDKRRSGWLERIGPARYRLGGVHIKTTLPHGLVPEAVWVVLFTMPDRKPLRSPEITGEAEAFVNRPGVSLYQQVATVLSRWHHSGHLERTGKRGEYAWCLREGVVERPICINKTS